MALYRSNVGTTRIIFQRYFSISRPRRRIGFCTAIYSQYTHAQEELKVFALEDFSLPILDLNTSPETFHRCFGMFTFEFTKSYSDENEYLEKKRQAAKFDSDGMSRRKKRERIAK